jgi:DNA-binding HxlR family transcriptional regulator
MPQDFMFSSGKNAVSAKKIPPRFQRRSKLKDKQGEEVGQRFFTVFDVVGDRWTSLVIAAAFFGLKRFNDIGSSIGIATNILADRLKLLVRVGVPDRLPYQDKPVRYEYHLSEMGRDMYPRTVAIHEWADRWLIKKGAPPLILRHLPCDKRFVSEVVCSNCVQPLVASEVSFERVLSS